MKPLILASMLSATTAHADIVVQFRDGVPKDLFTITNTGACTTGEVYLNIDLITASSGVIFDTAEGGAGVGVFQPFELVKGAERVTFASEVPDGANGLTIIMSNLAPLEEVAFTIDLDDFSSDRKITVNGSEIQGGFAVIDTGDVLLDGEFDDTGRAVVLFEGCTGSS